MLSKGNILRFQPYALLLAENTSAVLSCNVCVGEGMRMGTERRKLSTIRCGLKSQNTLQNSAKISIYSKKLH